MDVWDSVKKPTTMFSITSVHPKSFRSLARQSLAEFASWINYDLRIGFFDVFPFDDWEIKFSVAVECPRVLFVDPKEHVALFSELKRLLEYSTNTMEQCFDALVQYGDGRITARQAAELPFTSTTGSASSTPSPKPSVWTPASNSRPTPPPTAAAAAASGTLPDGVLEVLTAISNCGWTTTSTTFVSAVGACRTWKITMPMGPASERFDVQIVVIDNMPNTIDVRVLCFYPVTQSLTPSVVTNLMEFAARANYALPVGHFDLSRDAGGKPVVFVGTTRFTAAASLEHLPLLAARLMHTCFAVTSKYYSAVMGILRGSRDSVERLVAVCEGDTSGASGCGVGGSTAVPAGVAEVKAALDMKGWTARSIEHVSTHGATKIWKVAMSKGTGAKKFEVEIEVRDTMPDTIYVSVKSTFPETSRSSTVIANFTEFVTRANYDTRIGRLDVNLSTLMGSGAKVEYFTSVMFSAASLGHLRHLVVELFDRNFHTLDRYWEGLMKVFRNGDRDDLRVAAIVDECEGGSKSSFKGGVDSRRSDSSRPAPSRYSSDGSCSGSESTDAMVRFLQVSGELDALKLT